MRKSSAGLTLIELLIVISIIAILAVVGSSLFNSSTQKAKRTDVQAAMLNIAQKMESRKNMFYAYTADGTATTATAASTLADSAIYGSSTGAYPQTGNALYTLSFSGLTADTWELTATPKTPGIMSGNGVIKLNSQNQRCWTKYASSCSLSTSSRWDGK